MFTVYHSNGLDILKSLLVNRIQAEPLADPFLQEQILVQSPGMAQWLKIELAEADGIAASIDFPLPATFLWNVFKGVLDEVPERSAFNKASMTWRLMAILPRFLAEPEFAPLGHYLEQDSGGYKQYQLAGRIADVFDQYLVYRPEWIADWEAGGAMGADSQPWQPILWRALYENILSSGASHWHRANMFAHFEQALANPRAHKTLPKRLFVFGISALPENYLTALRQMGKYIDVHLMITNPCRHYWGDIDDPSRIQRLKRRGIEADGLETGNPLLASMGKLGRDYLSLIYQQPSEEIDAFIELGDNRLLGLLQRDILDLRDASQLPKDWQTGTLLTGEHKHEIEPDDTSLVIHRCHSPLREVEVLHDQLLARFEASPNLTPRDVIVMVPDVGKYAPYIASVFGNQPEKRSIPYSIADQSSAQESPLLQNVQRLLALKNSRFSVTDLLEILELPATLRAFELSESGFQRVRRWVVDAQIRWGLDDDHQASWDLPALHQNSWRFGLNRMMAGYSLGNTAGLWQGIAPYAEVEGLEADALGGLYSFLDALKWVIDTFTGEATGDEWRQQGLALIERFFAPDADELFATDHASRLVNQFADELVTSEYDAQVAGDIFIDYMNNGLTQQPSSHRFMVGAVNFCTLMPMRSIPFKQVCLLGMNDGDYPRSMPPLGFDLIASQPRRGDRSRRDDDRYLFLEAFLSAQEQFYISYVGASIHDNRARVPSVLVSEVLDYIHAGYCLYGEQGLAADESGNNALATLNTDHPLTPYNAHYFAPQSPLFSYASEWVSAAESEPGAGDSFLTKSLTATTPDTIDLTDLTRFFRNPAKYFFNQRLKVYFESEQYGVEEYEPFELDKLTEYLLKDRYLAVALESQSHGSQDDLDELDQQVFAEGALPVAYAGAKQLGKIRHESEVLAEKLAVLCDGEANRREVRVTLDQVTLVGWQNNWFDNRLVLARPAQINGRDRIILWLNHLAACATHHEQPLEKSWYRGLSGQCAFAPLTPAEARSHLNDLVAVYLEGLQRPIGFQPDIAWAWQGLARKDEAPDKDGTSREKADSTAEGLFVGGFKQRSYGSDPYIARVFPHYQSFAPDLEAYAERLLATPLALIEESGDE